MSRHLPHGLRIIADAAGVEAALEVAMNHGGRRVRIPQKADGSDLALMVGIDAARKIVNDFADERVLIPSSARLLNAWLRENGWSQERRAARLHRGRTTIQNWDKQDRDNSDQLNLFDETA